MGFQRVGRQIGCDQSGRRHDVPQFLDASRDVADIRVWHPRAPDKTEVWSWVYVDKAAPPHIKEMLRLTGVRGFSPSGTFEQDDMDNWQECTRTCRGVVSRRMVTNTQMGLGHERFREDLNAWASDFRMSESNHRQFYGRWAQLMQADSWAEMLRGNGWAGNGHAGDK